MELMLPVVLKLSRLILGLNLVLVSFHVVPTHIMSSQLSVILTKDFLPHFQLLLPDLKVLLLVLLVILISSSKYGITLYLLLPQLISHSMSHVGLKMVLLPVPLIPLVLLLVML